MPRVLLRRLALDRNPLRRRSDRLRVWVSVAGVVLAMVTLPLTVLPVMDHVHRTVVREQSEQVTNRHRVSAVTLRAGRPQPLLSAASMAEPGASARPPAGVPARWRGPDGRSHQGTVVVARPVRAGDVVPIWIDGNGAVAPPPVVQYVGVRSAFSGVAAGAGIVVLIGVMVRLARRWLTRRSTAAWEREWVVVAPRWNRQY